MKVIQLFKLTPEELFTTSEYFCNVFGICRNSGLVKSELTQFVDEFKERSIETSALYENAQKVVAERWITLNGLEVHELEDFTTKIETVLKEQMKDLIGQGDKSVDEMLQIIANGKIISKEKVKIQIITYR